MEKITVVDSSHQYTDVLSYGELGAGNAPSRYKIRTKPNADGKAVHFLDMDFQEGPIQTSGVNGIMNENLIAIVIDRLKGFQTGPYKCRENAIALTKLEEALMWLKERTRGREARGVEGTHEV